jgi:thiaminase/transcriptional activator TenA
LSEALWQGSVPISDQIHVHGFVAGVRDGTLPREVFGHYVAQDIVYMRAYTQCMAVLAARAPASVLTNLLVKQLGGAVAVESELHRVLLDTMNLDDALIEDTQASPTCFAYANWMLAVCERESFLQGLSAILPCYWVYGVVGKHLSSHGSTDPVLDTWARSYGGEVFEAGLLEVLDMVDDCGASASAAEWKRCTELFAIGTRYEWMFWDAALRQESWPIALRAE